MPWTFYHQIWQIIKSAPIFSYGLLQLSSFWCWLTSFSFSCLFFFASHRLDWTTSFHGPCKKFICISASPWILSIYHRASFFVVFSTFSSSFCFGPSWCDCSFQNRIQHSYYYPCMILRHYGAHFKPTGKHWQRVRSLS